MYYELRETVILNMQPEHTCLTEGLVFILLPYDIQNIDVTQ